MTSTAGAIYKLKITNGTIDAFLYKSELLKYNYDRLSKDRVKDAYAAREHNIRNKKWSMDQEAEFNITVRKLGQKSINDALYSHVFPIEGIYKPYVPIQNVFCLENASGGTSFGSTINFTPKEMGTYITDMLLHIVVSSVSAITPGDTVRAARFFGHRFIHNASCTTSGGSVVLDSFDANDIQSFYEHEVPKSMKKTWRQMVADTVPVKGLQLPYVGSPYLIGHSVYDGPQVPKATIPAFEMFIPMVFWFNNYGQSLLLSSIAPNTVNINIQTEISPLMYDCLGTGSLTFTAPTIELAEMVYNAYTLPVYFISIFVRTHDTKIVRVRRRSTPTKIDITTEIPLSDIYLPVESLVVNIRPSINATYTQNWFVNASFTNVQINYPAYDTAPIPTVFNSPISTYTSVAAFTSLQLLAADIALTPKLSNNFHGVAVPNRVKSHSEDPYAAIIPFAPIYQNWNGPLGHVNFSQKDVITLRVELRPSVGECDVLIYQNTLQILKIDNGVIRMELLT
jgi:hypothetical protein